MEENWLSQYLPVRRPTTPPMRIGHAEREQVVQDLKEHTQAGRLDMHEFEERVSQAYAAKTTVDLAPITADLPSLQPEPSRAGRRRRRRRGWISAAVSSWLSVSAMMVVIWFATGMGFFWPIWVIGPWGACLIPSVVNEFFGHRQDS